MSNIPELLLEHAAGLRKEASAAMQDLEALGHCAVLLLEKAAETKNEDIAITAANLSHDFLLSKEAAYGDYDSDDMDDHRSRIEELESHIESLYDRIKEMDEVNKTLAGRVIQPTADEIRENREYLARGLAYKAQRDAAYNAARRDKEESSTIIGRHPVATGVLGGAGTGAAIGSLLGKGPGAAIGGMIGAGVGAIAGGIANSKKESGIHDSIPHFANHPSASAAHERVYNEAMEDLADDDVKKRIIDSVLYPNKYNSPKETHDNAKAALRLYKAAAEQAVSELIARGLDRAVAEAALDIVGKELSDGN